MTKPSPRDLEHFLATLIFAVENGQRRPLMAADLPYLRELHQRLLRDQAEAVREAMRRGRR